MIGFVTIYKDKFGKNWIVDADGGSREHPGHNREGFTTWRGAVAEATLIASDWRYRYPRLATRVAFEGVERAHKKAAAAKAERALVAA